MWRGGCCDATFIRTRPLLSRWRRSGLRRRRWLWRLGWWRGRRLGRCGCVCGRNQLDIEDEVTLRGDHRGPAALSIRELVGNEEAALPTDMHSRKAVVPAGNDAVDSLLEGDGLI